MSANKITMADLRGKLFNAIDDVSSGDLEPSRAQAIAKLAAQLNQSLITEIEMQKVSLLKQIGKPYDLGDTPIAEATPLLEGKAE